MIHFFIPCNPVGKGRPRFVNRGRFMGAYTPAKTREFEKMLAYHANTHRPPEEDMKKPVRLTIHLAFERPKSAKRLRHTVRPDIDNCIKLVLDSFNGILWHDDSQIVQLTATKSYKHFGYSEAGIELCLEYLGGDYI